MFGIYFQHIYAMCKLDFSPSVKLSTDEEGRVYSMSSEGRICVSLSTCECTSWKSMKLPCRHIFAARAEAAANLFDETLVISAGQ